ncbi:unnamed protein product [Durusdinium trenchii]|uniref:Uncharacterized protein n=1 Tax=Durusdinium trenchii TaxID=1381693 RepID=A0ABP0N6Q8_9DINO
MKRSETPSGDQAPSSTSPLDEFAGLKGQLFVEEVFSRYGCGTTTIPWLINGERAIRPDPTNRPIMESLAEAYADRILTSGLNVDCSGSSPKSITLLAWMVYGPSNQLPVYAITFGHRSEALYRALSRDEDNVYVQRAMSTGLENVRMLRPDTPVEVRRALCTMHNQYHQGTGETWISLLDKSEEIMRDWETRTQETGLTTRSASYDSFLEKFVFRERGESAWGESLNYFKSTTILNNYLNKYGIKDQLRSWCNNNLNFADFKINNRDIILMLHQLAIIISNGLTKYWAKEYIGLALLEAIKFCVPTRHNGGGQRLLPQIFFKPGAETVANMNLLVVPMASSVVFKRLEAESQSAADECDNTTPVKGKGKKGKSKKTAASKRKPGKGKGNDCDGEDCETRQWSSMVFPLCDDPASAGEGRQKTALDDFMSIVTEVIKRYQAKYDKLEGARKLQSQWETSMKSMFSHTVSCFMEFAWSGSVALNGKFTRTYSSFREELTTFATTACELALTSSSTGITSGQQAPLGLGTTLSDLFEGSGEVSSSNSMPLHQMKDASDETAALRRIETNLKTVTESGMQAFINNILVLPLEFHNKFSTAKQELATDSSISEDSTPMQVLQRISAQLSVALPPSWIAFAADVSELHSVRLDFVADSGKVFGDNKYLLEKFLLVRSFYNLTLLRDLANIRKTKFSPSVNLVITFLHVEVGHLMENIEQAIKARSSPASADVAAKAKKAHPVAMLLAAFDVLQSALV